MKKRSMLILASVLLAVVVVGATMAWFTDRAAAVNTFRAGTVDVSIIENDIDLLVCESGFTKENVNPGDTYDKKIEINSKGSKRTYVRVRLIPTWTLAVGKTFPTGYSASTLPPAEIRGLNTTDWILGSDGYYYYKSILSTTNTTTKPLMTGVHFNGANMPNEYQGASFVLRVEVEAIQATNGAAESQWGVDTSASGLGLEQPTP